MCNLTERTIAALSLGSKSERIWFDDRVPGFGYRLRKSGVASWIYQYKVGRLAKRITLGRAGAIKSARAREIASELHARVRLGHDPASEKQEAILRSRHTVGNLAAQYLEHQRDQIRLSSFKEVHRHLEIYAAPLHALPVDTIDRAAIAERLNAVAKVSGNVTANRTAASLSALFGWAMRQGLASSNPAIGTLRRTERPRSRILTEAEIKIIWTALPDDRYGAIVKLLLLSGQRLDEIAGLRWSEVDFDRNLIVLPGERTKNNRAHEIPLTSTMRALLEAQPREGELVFRSFGAFSRAKKMLDNAVSELNGDIAPWTHHDLRRSCATHMAELGVQPHIIEAVLNHVSGHKGGIAGIYNHANYRAEKAEALARWDRHIAGLVQ